MIDVQDLHVTFHTSKGKLHAVRGINFQINPGEIVGIVGESGCGKSAAIKALTQLHPRASTLLSGKILYQGQNLLEYSNKQMSAIRGKEISMIFQDPMTSLNPTLSIGYQIMEGYRQHFPHTSKAAAKNKAIDMLHKVGITSPDERFHDYPHQLSGGMRQRVMIALALACEPKLLLADEPTTALDVTTQAQILSLLASIQKEMGTTLLLITHDLALVATFCDRILVMYAGQIIESASARTLFSSPQHPYTQELIAAIPKLDQPKDMPLRTIIGTPPNLLKPITGCSFCPRCPQAMRICSQQEPTLLPLPSGGHSACFQYHPERHA